MAIHKGNRIHQYLDNWLVRPTSHRVCLQHTQDLVKTCQSDWSKVSLYPSPSFLSKNQLAKEGPDSVAPVVIPALAPTLDRSLKSDSSSVQSEPCATTWIGPRTLGRIKSWSLSPSRKVLTRTSHLPIFLLMDQTDCDPML